MMTGVKVSVWRICEETHSCVDVRENSSEGHEAIRQPLSGAEGHSLHDRGTMVTKDGSVEIR